MVNRKSLTAAMIDSRDFLAARRRAETEVMLPAGPKVAFTGGMDCSDHTRIWDVLDKVHAKHPGMVLLHGGSPKGAERIAACWADNRKIIQVAFTPDWTGHAKAAPFKRNDQLFDVLPIRVVVFPGSGISDDLAEEARKLGKPQADLCLGFPNRLELAGRQLSDWVAGARGREAVIRPRAVTAAQGSP